MKTLKEKTDIFDYIKIKISSANKKNPQNRS